MKCLCARRNTSFSSLLHPHDNTLLFNNMFNELIYYIQWLIIVHPGESLEEERNVKWILIISIIMLSASTFVGSISYYPYYPPREPSILDVVAFYINRIDILFFIATITTATLATTGFRKKDLMYKASIYLFIISMILLIASILKWLFTYPWTR